MASAAEQLASNMNFSAFSRATDLKKRIWFTLGALLVYRLGTYIPLPGINPVEWANSMKMHEGGLMGLANLFSGGAIDRMAVVALGITPYITASIIIQLLTSVIPSLEALKKEGESGRKIINQYTRYATVGLAIVQAYGMALLLEAGFGRDIQIVMNPGWFFRFSTIITMLGGTMFLMWLGEQITSRGIGNGISLIIFAGIVAGLPGAVYSMLSEVSGGRQSSMVVVIVFILAIAVIAAIVFMERAQRRLLIQYPKRQMGNRMFQGDTSHLPLKLNTSGVIPPIFASSLLMLPATFSNFIKDAPLWLQNITTALTPTHIPHMIVYAALMVFFCFFYTAIVFNPKDTADQLKKHGGFIPGIRPGERTADYIDYVLTRITVVGAGYIVVVCLLPEVLTMSMGGFLGGLGGTSLLIVVTVTLDTVAQIQGHLVAHQYEGLIKKSKLRGGRRHR